MVPYACAVPYIVVDVAQKDILGREILDVYDDRDVLIGVDRRIPLQKVLLHRFIGRVKREKVPGAQFPICCTYVYIQGEGEIKRTSRTGSEKGSSLYVVGRSPTPREV